MSRMHDCSQVIHSTVEVLLRQMPNHQCAVLAHSSGVGVRHAFVVEQVLPDKTEPIH